MFYFYFGRPIESLVSSWQIKLSAAVLLTYFWSIARELLNVWTDLLALPIFLIGMASVAFMADFLTAIVAAYRDEGVGGIKFLQFRRLLIKAAEWALIIIVASNLATGAKKAESAMFAPFIHIDAVCVFWLSIQDAWSSLKNLKGRPAALDWVQGATAMMQGKFSAEDVTGDSEPATASDQPAEQTP